VAICQVTIEPQNIVVRQDQMARLMCKTRTPIRSCLWEINGDLYNLAEGGPYEPLGVLEDGECGIQVSRTHSHIFLLYVKIIFLFFDCFDNIGKNYRG
jgi:hypothetical protein